MAFRKSIGRCRCVSKSWLSLLSQPYFIKTHIDQTRTTRPHYQCLLLAEVCFSLYCATLDDAHQVFDKMSLRATMLDFVDDHSDYWLRVVSCDGLILIASIHKLILLNPITHQVKHIPFHPDKSASTIYGLGYDSVNHDYKITILTRYFTKRDSLVKVYSVKNGAWRNLQNCPYDRAFYAYLGVFLNGYVHWLVSGGSENKLILSFDLALEKFCEARLPLSVTKDLKYGTTNGIVYIYDIMLLGGCLCVFCSSYSGETCVWIMEYGNNESWTKFTVIDPRGGPCKPICMLDQEQVLVERRHPGIMTTVKLIKYNLKNGTCKDIVVDGIDSVNIYARAIFVQGLASPYCSYETS